VNTSPRHLPLTVEVSDTQRGCPRCGGHSLMTAYVPHGWVNSDGTQTGGNLPVVLCPACDAGSAAGGPLITYFHVHGAVDHSTVIECAALIQAWADSITIPPLDQARLDAEIRAWHAGEL
jgi:Family of unknown function (DUF6300)